MVSCFASRWAHLGCCYKLIAVLKSPNTRQLLSCSASAILYYMAPRISAFAINSPLIPSVITISITTCLNLILTTVIAGRLFYHQETMQRILGKEYRTPYLRIIIMLVESCSLIVVTGIIFLIFVARGSTKTFDGCIVPFLLFPHVCVSR